jgi:hypothetical protein
MSLRLVILLLSAVSAVASDFSDNWPSDKTEKLNYEMIIYGPTETKTTTEIEITKAFDAESVFVVAQTFEMPTQSFRIKATEKYRIPDLEFLDAQTVFFLPPEAKAQLGTDTVTISARAVDDSLAISSSSPIVPGAKMAAPDDLTTTVGALLTGRNFDFKPGGVRKFHQIDFLNFTGKPFAVVERVDSVVADDSVTVPAGFFKCHKTKRILGEQIGYGYYSVDNNNLPVVFEVINKSSNAPLTRISLVKFETSSSAKK